MIPESVQADFFEGTRRETRYAYNDSVFVLPERLAATIVVLSGLAPTRYVVERCDGGGDVDVSESDLLPNWQVCGVVEDVWVITARGPALVLEDNRLLVRFGTRLPIEIRSEGSGSVRTDASVEAARVGDRERTVLLCADLSMEVAVKGRTVATFACV